MVFNNPDPDVEIQWWMAQYYMRAPAIASKFPSLGYDQVVGTVVRGYVKENPDIQTAIVNQAYQTVLYREATPDELNTWVPQIMAGKKYFASIVADLKKQK